MLIRYILQTLNLFGILDGRILHYRIYTYPPIQLIMHIKNIAILYDYNKKKSNGTAENWSRAGS